MIPGDKTGFGQRGKRWFTGQKTRRLEADAARLIEAVKDLPAAPPGVQLSDRRRAEIAHALKPFGVSGYQPPHRAPAEKDVA